MNFECYLGGQVELLHLLSWLQVCGIATNAQLKQLVRHAVELAVQEIVAPVIERSIKIAINTVEHIIKKDFALDPDESRMRAATHHMVRNLTAAMAMITCRDYLATNITKSIKQGLVQAFSRVSIASYLHKDLKVQFCS